MGSGSGTVRESQRAGSEHGDCMIHGIDQGTIVDVALNLTGR
jgi:hypothetical protein